MTVHLSALRILQMSLAEQSLDSIGDGEGILLHREIVGVKRP